MPVIGASDTAEVAREFAASAEALIRARSPLARLRQAGEGSEVAQSLWPELAEAGWTSLLMSEDLGGLGLGLRNATAMAEAIGGHPIPEQFVAIAVQSALALDASPRGGLRDALVADLLTSQCLPALAWQEQVGELTPTGEATQASLVGGTLRLSGKKNWVAGGTEVAGWLVLARGEGGPWLLWVPKGIVGASMQLMTRVDRSPMCSVEFSDVALPASHIVAQGQQAIGAVRDSNDAARVAQAAELLGCARGAFQLTLDYLKTRVQFGQPIGSNQALQHRMVDAFLGIELATAGLQAALGDLAAGSCSLAAAASRTKARCAAVALTVTRLAVQLHGAIGFTEECDIGLYLKRALHLSSWLGGPVVHALRYQQLAGADVVTNGADDGPHPAPVGSADWDKMSEDDFRSMVRGFLIENYPKHLRHPAKRLHWHEARDWYITLSKQGWIAPGWPAEHGGMDLPPQKLLAFIDEMEAYGAARLPDQGVINLGPVLIRFGSAEQKQRYLPRIISGEHIWCQGYSEPNAGSDLASLRTEARLDGDYFVVNGQKIWTTLAQDATHIFMLVRTSRGAKKQDGISFLVAELSTPGITVRPIRNIAGEDEFCEVFFDDVRVPRENLVGEIGKGWGIAKALLGFERLFIGSPKTCQYALAQLLAVGTGRGIGTEARFERDCAQLRLDVADLGAMYASFAEIAKQGASLPESVSLLKIWASETYQRIADKVVEYAADHGGTDAECHFGTQAISPMVCLFNSTVTTIYGGTNEIQRNILAKRVLGLPN